MRESDTGIQHACERWEIHEELTFWETQACMVGNSKLRAGFECIQWWCLLFTIMNISLFIHLYIDLFLVYLTTLSVPQTIYHRIMIGLYRRMVRGLVGVVFPLPQFY